MTPTDTPAGKTPTPTPRTKMPLTDIHIEEMVVEAEGGFNVNGVKEARKRIAAIDAAKEVQP